MVDLVNGMESAVVALVIGLPACLPARRAVAPLVLPALSLEASLVVVVGRGIVRVAGVLILASNKFGYLTLEFGGPSLLLL